MKKIYDTIIIGGGQAGLSAAYFLKRYHVDYLILDDQPSAGGSWNQTWDDLHLFSPSEFSSLSGWQLPTTKETYPTKNEFLAYLAAYEKKYDFPIHHHELVSDVHYEKGLFTIFTNEQHYQCKTVISATGTAKSPFIPPYAQRAKFEGRQIHSINYKNAHSFANKKVLIVGGGNSGAQILAEVSKVAHTTWVTKTPPHFLPDDIDGRYIFDQANAQFYGKPTQGGAKSLADIVMIDSVKEARSRGVLHAKAPFDRFYAHGVVWPDGQEEPFDAVIWCTGFKAALHHLKGLNIVEQGRVSVNGTQSTQCPGLFLVGYGNWTGYASATIYGVGKTARQTAKDIHAYLQTD